ncbi:GtrA family protein [Streptomyces sp. NPDC091406]|uniref:GtrA family protein n=1 Tax=unclassified Streptomyces TaxID=2593676 RepID=UPI0038050A5F
MSERGALRARLDLLAREVAKFGAVGLVGLLVNIAVFNLLRHTTDLQVVRASVLATFVAILCNYVGFRYWTYRDRDKTGRTRELTLFLLFSAAGAVIENGVLYLATYGFDWNSPVQSNVFKILGIGIATLFRFWSYRTWVFKALPDPSPAEPSPSEPSSAEPSSAEEAARPAERFLEQRRPTETVEPDPVRN